MVSIRQDYMHTCVHAALHQTLVFVVYNVEVLKGLRIILHVHVYVVLWL